MTNRERYFDPDVVAARDAVGKAIRDYIAVVREDHHPFVVAWAVSIEWTNSEMERTAKAGRDTIAPTEQTASASIGLGWHLVHKFG